jgi:hypothetical protein
MHTFLPEFCFDVWIRDLHRYTRSMLIVVTSYMRPRLVFDVWLAGWPVSKMREASMLETIR